MSKLSTYIGAGLIGAGIALLGAGIYIKKYYENSKANNIEQWKQPPLKVKKPIILPNLKTTSPLFTSIGNVGITEKQELEKNIDLLMEHLDLPVLHDFAKLAEFVPDAASHAQDTGNHSDSIKDSSAMTAVLLSEEKKKEEYVDNVDNVDSLHSPILLLADMKSQL